MDRSLGIGYAGGTLILVALLMASLLLWYRTLGTVAVDTVSSPKSEMFYWVTIMFSQTLGTALGDWTADTASGTASKNQAIWIESADSIGFSMGFTCTSFIPEEQAARFLYWYPAGSLANVMDTEVRGRMQQIAAEVAARYRLDVLREKKQEISDAVKKDITDFFAQRGVVITTVGMFGGMTYENGEIQKSIDNTVIAQQLKVVNQARFEAQQHDNDRVELEANAIAERARRIAAGEADAKKIAAFAEAQSIREVNKALAEARQNPLLYQLRALEVERARVDHWNGQYPAYFVGTSGGQSPNLLMQMPPAPR